MGCAPDQAFRPISRIGGDAGWYYGNALWRLRGLLDLAVGGPGMRRGRRDPESVKPGETVDFWRVEAVEPGRLLRLAAEMRIPGRAWLQFEVTPADGGSLIRQTALFDPVGVGGLLYWYGLWGIHRMVFAGMLRNIARAATTVAVMAPCERTPVTPPRPAGSHALEDKAFLALLVAVSLAFVWILWPFFGAVLWGVILAIVFSPLYRRLLKSMRQRRTLAALATLGMILVLVILPLTLLTALLVQEGAAVYERIQSGEFDIGRYFQQAFNALPGWVTGLLDRFGLTNLGLVAGEAVRCTEEEQPVPCGTGAEPRPEHAELRSQPVRHALPAVLSAARR